MDDLLVESETRESLGFVNRLLKIFPCEIVVPELCSVVKDLLVGENWGNQYAAIMALS